MIREIEALLFATDAPLTTKRLRAIFKDSDGQEIRDAIETLRTQYDEGENAFTVVEFGGGWQIASRAEYAPLIENLFKGRRYTRLSRAALEVLSIIAYRQPVTRIEMEEVRGVQCGGVISTLLERNLVSVAGRAETVGHPLLYGTTREFLSYLGLNAVGQLPQLPDVEALLGDRDGLRDFARSIGSELSDNEIDDYGREPEEEVEAQDQAEGESSEATGADGNESHDTDPEE